MLPIEGVYLAILLARIAGRMHPCLLCGMLHVRIPDRTQTGRTCGCFMPGAEYRSCVGAASLKYDDIHRHIIAADTVLK